MPNDPSIHAAHVVAGVVEGGLKKHVTDLTRAQLAQGLRVSVIARPELLEALDAGVERREAKLHLGRRDPRALLALAGALRALRPDVVHAHASKAAGMLALLRALGLVPRIPLVATLHSVKRSLREYEAADRVIAVSPGAAAQITRAPVTVIPNGVPAPAEIAPPPPRNRPRAIAVGRLVPVKGFDVLLNAWRDIRADLEIVGDGVERARLESQTTKLGLDDRVSFLGYRADAPRLLQRADLVVVPSRREGFSYVMAEALLARRPIVATRVPGPADYLPESHLAEPEDATALAQIVRGALADLPAATAALEPAFDRARAELTLEAMGEQTLAVYRDALGSHTRSAPSP